MLKFGNLKFIAKFSQLISLLNLHNSNLSVTVTCSNTLQDIITIDKHTHYINCGDIDSLNIDSVQQLYTLGTVFSQMAAHLQVLQYFAQLSYLGSFAPQRMCMGSLMRHMSHVFSCTITTTFNRSSFLHVPWFLGILLYCN